MKTSSDKRLGVYRVAIESRSELRTYCSRDAYSYTVKRYSYLSRNAIRVRVPPVAEDEYKKTVISGFCQ